jgi:short subunit dehydrogenase-like uncharacterized protein
MSSPLYRQAEKESVEWRGVADADIEDSSVAKRTWARIRWNGSMYHLTGVCVAESALLLAREETPAHELGGGFLTPATLGRAYVERLQKAGAEVEVKMLD